MNVTRRQLTFIILKPDGTNYTRELTGRSIRILVTAGTLFLLVCGGLLYTVIHQHVRLRRLWAEHQLLVGREIVALAPRPTSAGAVPGAADPSPATRVTESGGGGDSPTAAPDQSAATPAIRSQTDLQAPPLDQAPARVEAFSLLRNQSGIGWVLEAQLRKREWTGELLQGYIAVLIEDGQRPGRYYTIPPLTVDGGYPLSPRAGDSFAIRRLKPLHFEFTLPEGFLMREVRILVYDREGTLLAEQAFAVQGMQ